MTTGRTTISCSIIALMFCLCVTVCAETNLKSSLFEVEHQKIKYAFALSDGNDDALPDARAESSLTQTERKRKSPFKAFVLSSLVPGLGQYYVGNNIRAAGYFGLDVASWVLYAKYHGDGQDATDTYEDFNHAHWSRFRYEQQYLSWNYGVTDDEDIQAQELSHHLPDEETQQYFEMTGKYNQFAWGWDDATYNDSTLDHFSQANPPPKITSEVFTPASANRHTYEGLRHNANQKFARARKMIIVSIVNRLVSGFDALISARKHNEKDGRNSVFSGLKVTPKLRSMYEFGDTPYVKLAYKF